MGGNFLDVLLSVGIFIVFAVGCGSILKFVAFRARTRDGDSFANRLLGHGPDDEVFDDPARSWVLRPPEPTPPKDDAGNGP